MNASFEWLKAFVPTGLSAEEVRDLITSRCATVEELVELRSDLRDIVVGRVLTAERHPNSDHLWLTTVDAGTGEPLTVVCGAPNVEAGARYPFAPVGATLPGGLKIERRKIRGETSTGMLCSARELALGADHEGILKLDGDADPGTPFLEAMPVGGTRFVIDVLPNRPDLLSHEGVARELAAATGAKMSRPKIPGPSITVPAPSAKNSRNGAVGGVEVEITDSDGCQRYAAAVVRGVRVGPSPDWLSRRIEDAGGRSVNNVVDVTNYMLLGFGQPMHVFDLAKLDGPKVTIRRAGAGETIATLDGRDRALTAEMTVIADGSRAQAIAGVIGGSGSEVTEATTDVFLEVAAFDPKRVRSTRRTLGVSTDASYRFERGVDVEQIPDLLAYAVQAIIAAAGGEADGTPVDLHPVPVRREPVMLRPSRVSQVLGVPVEASEIIAHLTSIGFEVSGGRKAKELRVVPPTWRSDVTVEVDLIEEVARLHGYDTLPSEMRPFRPGTVQDAPVVRVSDRVREALVARGLVEVRPMPFVTGGADAAIRVRNPLAENEAYLRASILPTLAGRAEYNLARMQGDVRMFEIGNVFAASAAGAGGEGASLIPAESTRAAALIMGRRRPVDFTEPHPPVFDEWDARGLAEFLARTAYPSAAVQLGEAGGESLWSILVDGRALGVVRRVKLDAPVWAAPAFGVELDISGADAAVVHGGRYVPLPVTPAVEVDFALLGEESVSAAAIEGAIRSAAGELLESLILFDEFRGKGIPEGQRSTAWRLTFRHPERTLRDKEVQGRTEKILRTLEGELGVRQRKA